MKEVYKNIFRIEVPLPGNPLKETNSYLIRGNEKDLLIDTGFRKTECREALNAGLKTLGSDRSRLNVLITHVHSDHSALAAEYAGKKCKIYMSKSDLKRQKDSIESGKYHKDMVRRFLKEGFPEEILDYISINNPARKYAMESTDGRFTPLRDGDILQVGEYNLRIIEVPGHTPGNLMIYLEKEKIMFTGDHILFDITPNITAFPDTMDSLGDYLNSLKRSKVYDVYLALPGHRESGNYEERINMILQHHNNRIEEAYQAILEQQGRHAFDITGMMRWRISAKNWAEFPAIQKWYAVGECLSHLDYLRLRGYIEREEKNGTFLYRTTSRRMTRSERTR